MRCVKRWIGFIKTIPVFRRLLVYTLFKIAFFKLAMAFALYLFIVFNQLTSRMMIRFLILLFSVAAFCISAFGQDVTVSASGSATLAENLSLSEAQELAKSRARVEAIEKALGIDVRNSQFLQKFELLNKNGNTRDAGDAFAQFIEQSREGKIIAESAWQLSSAPIESGKVIEVRATNTFTVRRDTKKADKNFLLDLRANKHDFKPGEKISLELAATQACYVTIFNVANDTVSVLFPNEVDTDNRFAKDAKRTVPNVHYSLIASIPTDRSVSPEYIVAVALKDSIIFRGTEKVKVAGYAETFRAGATDLWKWLTTIDRDRRVEAVEFFKVSSK
jgi:hypothetical protein